MRDVHDCPNPRPKPEPVEFTPDEAKAGRAMRGNTLHYCCYGMYCDAGHDSDCPVAHGVAPSQAPRLLTDDEVAECDERYYFKSARSIQRKFCEVNGLPQPDPHGSGVAPSQAPSVPEADVTRISGAGHAGEPAQQHAGDRGRRPRQGFTRLFAEGEEVPRVPSPAEQYHEAVLAIVGGLMHGDPAEDSPEGRLLVKLADAVEAYERATLPPPLGNAGVMASEQAGRCKHCGVTPGSVVQVGWICKDDLKRLRETGEAEVYEERQEFTLLPEQEQFPVYVRKDAAGGMDVEAPSPREEAKKARPPSDEEPWVVADETGLRVTFRNEDAAWRYRDEYTDRLVNPTVTHEPASASVAPSQAHSKSEYKRRVAMGDPNVAPPLGVEGTRHQVFSQDTPTK